MYMNTLIIISTIVFALFLISRMIKYSFFKKEKVRVKRGVTIIGIKENVDYVVLKKEKGFLCHTRYLVKNEEGQIILLCSHHVDA